MIKKPYYVKESQWNPNMNDIINSNNNNCRDSILMNKIMNFYLDNKHLSEFKKIINGKSLLSLRIIDFFVTNYARDKEVIYSINKNEKKENFMVYYNYKSQLKAYSKKQFDPFCRRERIYFYINEHDGTAFKPIKTTVGQLNFFRWIIKHKILDYIYKNYKNIDYEMNRYSKKGKKKKKKKNIKRENFIITSIINDEKSRNLTMSTTKKINKHNITITVKFS